jgi:hypothetical protein
VSLPAVIGFALIGIGALGLLLARLHRTPSSTAVARLLSWPQVTDDRADLALRSVFTVAIGTTLVLIATQSNAYALLIAGVVALGAAVGIGVRRPAA